MIAGAGWIEEGLTELVTDWCSLVAFKDPKSLQHVLQLAWVFTIVGALNLPCFCRVSLSQDLFSISAFVYAQKPQLDIHSFEGNFTRVQ